MEEAVSKGNTLYGSIFRTFSERQSYRTGEQISGCQGPGDREGATTKGEHGAENGDFLVILWLRPHTPNAGGAWSGS